MYPTLPLARAMAQDPELIRHVWRALNAITPDKLLREGRVYGGGLHKLEPKELANVDASTISKLLPDLQRPAVVDQLGMFGYDRSSARLAADSAAKSPRAVKPYFLRARQKERIDISG